MYLSVFNVFLTRRFVVFFVTFAILKLTYTFLILY